MKNNLPKIIPIFPLSNAVFFPRTILPLNIFEDKYIQLINDCMKQDRMFGMIQPKLKTNNIPDIYNVGCLGKIVGFNETDDKRFVISLSGVIRFRVKSELNDEKLYRKFIVDYSEFLNDLDLKKNEIVNFDKNSFLKKIIIFLEKINYSIEYKELVKLDLDQLVNNVCMISPFSVGEKQKIIETVKIEDKVKTLDEIITSNIFELQENKTMQ
jgi:Lon protease-like protein|tara:strand:+ start:244 stop:879 length:636 start_codon:yes stop_codon:yes gene_type:complete